MKAPATYDDLISLPEHVVGEILDGELFASPRPAAKHAVAYTALLGQLFNPIARGIGGPGGWVILGEPELHLGSDVMVLLTFEEKGEAHVPPFDAFGLDLEALWTG